MIVDVKDKMLLMMNKITDDTITISVINDKRKDDDDGEKADGVASNR